MNTDINNMNYMDSNPEFPVDMSGFSGIGGKTITPEPPRYYFKDINDGIGHNYNSSAVKTAIRNILLTPRGSMPGRPAYGSNIQNLLFEQSDHLLQDLLDHEIRETLVGWENRIRILKIEAFIMKDNPNGLSVDIHYEYALEGFDIKEKLTLDLNREG